jgi:hypothetical protein
MIDCRILEPRGEGHAEADVKELLEWVLPLMPEFWERWGKAWYGLDQWHIEAVAFTHAWVRGDLVVMVASEGGRPMGFLVGGHVQPFFLPHPIFEVEAFYGRSPEAERALKDYLATAMNFFKERHLSFPNYPGQGEPLGGLFAPERNLGRTVYRK